MVRSPIVGAPCDATTTNRCTGYLVSPTPAASSMSLITCSTRRSQVCGAERVDVDLLPFLGERVLDRVEEAVEALGDGDQVAELVHVGDRRRHHRHALRAVDERLQGVHRPRHLVVEMRDQRDVEVPDESLGLLVRLHAHEVHVRVPIEAQDALVEVRGADEHELPVSGGTGPGRRAIRCRCGPTGSRRSRSPGRPAPAAPRAAGRAVPARGSRTRSGPARRRR